MCPQSWCVCLEAALRRPDASPRSRRGPWMPQPHFGLTSGLGCLSLASVSPRALDALVSPRALDASASPRSRLGPWMPRPRLGLTSSLGCLGLSLGLGCLGLSSVSPRALDASVSPWALDASASVSPRSLLGPWMPRPRSLLGLASGLARCLGLSSASPRALDASASASVSPRPRLKPWMPQSLLGVASGLGCLSLASDQLANTSVSPRLMGQHLGLELGRPRTHHCGLLYQIKSKLISTEDMVYTVTHYIATHTPI